MAAIPDRILVAMENTHRELNELELRLKSAMDDSGDYSTANNASNDDVLKNSPCDQCQQLRDRNARQKSPSAGQRKRSQNDENRCCPSCTEMSRRLDFMNDEMNRVCENEAKLKENLEALTGDYEMAQQELSMANVRIDGKARNVNENLEQIDNLKSQLLANSADRIASLQFELERKVDELQKLGEEHRYLLSLHYTNPNSGRKTASQNSDISTQQAFGAEFLDLSNRECQDAAEKDLKAISELKLALCENRKVIDDKDSKLSKKDVELQRLTEAYATLEGQLKMYMSQFEKLQGVVAEYKERDDSRYSRGVQNSDVMELEQVLPASPESRPIEANGATHDHDEFFQELEELTSRLGESRLQHSILESSRLDQSLSDVFRVELPTPKKKSVSFALDHEPESSYEVSRSESVFNESRLAQLALLEQKARAFELRAENLCQELDNVRTTLGDVNEARDDLSELVRVQEERIALFMRENEDLKSRLDRSLQESFDEGDMGDEDPQDLDLHEKEQRLETMIDEMEDRNCTIQDLARTSNESVASVDFSEILYGHDGSVASELHGLTSRLNEINRENELLHVQVDKAKVVIETLKKRIETFEDPNTTTEQQTLDRSSADNSQLDYARHENEMLHEKLEHREEKLAESEAEIREKEKQLTHLRALVQIKADRIRAVVEDLEKKEVKISSYIAMIKKMKETKKNDDEGKNYESKVSEEERVTWEDEKLNMAKELDRVEEEKRKVERELNFAKLRYDDLKEQVEDLENDFESLTNELAQAHDAKTSVESQLSKSSVANDDLRTRIAILEREITTRNVESQNVKSVKWALETKIADLKEHVQELESKLTTKTEKGDANLIDENKHLKECVDETMDRLAETDGECLKLRTDLDEAKDQLLTLEKDILLKDDRIDLLQAKADEIEDLRAQVHHSEDKRRLLEKVVLEKENYVTEMGTQIQTFTEKNEVLEEELNTATKNVEVLQSALDDREKELEVIQDEITGEKTEKASLTDLVRTLREKLQEAQTRPTFVESQVTPRKEPLLIDLSSPNSKSACVTPSRTYRIAKRTLTPARRTLNLDILAQKVNEQVLVDTTDPGSFSSRHQLSTSTLCFDLMEKSIVEIGPLEPKIVNETLVLATSQASFIDGVGTVSTPCPKVLSEVGHIEVDPEFKSLRENVETRAQTLMKQIEGLELECDDLRERCSKMEVSNEAYQTLFEGSREAQKILESRVLDLIQANHELQEKLREKVDLCTVLTNERDHLIQEFGSADHLVRELALVEAEKRDLCALLERLKCELNRITGLNCKLNQQVNELNERLENVDCVESELDDYKQALAEVEGDNTALKVEMEEKLGQLSNELTQAKTQCMQSNAKLIRFQNIEEEFENLNAQYGEVLRENEHMYEEIKELQASLRKLQDIERDFTALHRKNAQICKELSDLENVTESQESLKQSNADLESKCEELYQELESLKLRAEKADYLASELDKIREYYEDLLEAKSQNESELEKSLSKLDLIEINNKSRLKELHEDVRRAMEAKFQLELDLHQALHCAKESDSKHQRIANQLTRIVDERNDIVSRLNEVTQKLHVNEKETAMNAEVNAEVIVIE